MIQIFGTKKCKDTAKAVRYFKERSIQVHLVDLAEKAMSRGELKNIARNIPIEELIDKNSKAYEKRNLRYIKHDIEEELLADAALFKTPVVRYGTKSSVGYTPELWKEWLGK
ncbi:MAG TPA: ArsC/Spx/MgsR family protein [Spirochaetota bacterium]|nr:ArsC family transcriptional regulator [Spirochaetota bacterium]HQO38896.1 ArsC/Spx/MgsR family protein [Spirochaetota bacterium]